MQVIGQITQATASHCDGCGHHYDIAGHERVYFMVYRPDGADFELSYTLCDRCYSRFDADPWTRCAAESAALERAPRWVRQLAKRHRDVMADLPVAGHA